MEYRKLWIALGLVIVCSFAVLGIAGKQMIDQAPPIPATVVTTDGRVLFDGNTIQDGQGVWQSIGGQEVGSIWGHGAYVAPDWSADWLHRESVFILDTWARTTGAKDYSALPLEAQAGLRARLQQVMRTNTYDPNSGRITVDPVRAAAFEELARHYADVFGRGRPEYAIPAGRWPIRLNSDRWQHSSGGRPGPPARTAPAAMSLTPTTGRTNRWSAIAHGRRGRLERDQLCPSAGRYRRHGVVLRFAGAQRCQHGRDAPNAIRCSACIPRLRSEPR